MSLKILAVVPLLIMFVIIFIEAGSVATATGQPICFPNSNTGPCSSIGATGQSIITCPLAPSQICTNIKTTWLSLIPAQDSDLIAAVTNTCTALQQITGHGAPPLPATCGQDVFGIWNGQVLLIGGQSVTVPTQITNQVAASQLSSTGPITFLFNNSGPTVYGYVAMTIVAIGIVVVASIAIWGSSFTSLESQHILFVGGLMISLWIILSLAEGFVTGSQNSMFTQLNNQKVGGVSSGIGTALYLILSFMETVGVVFLVSRGE